MSEPLLKKQIAARAHISTRTMRNQRQQWSWIERCRTQRPGRPTYNSDRVNEELRRRKII